MAAYTPLDISAPPLPVQVLPSAHQTQETPKVTKFSLNPQDKLLPNSRASPSTFPLLSAPTSPTSSGFDNQVLSNNLLHPCSCAGPKWAQIFVLEGTLPLTEVQ